MENGPAKVGQSGPNEAEQKVLYFNDVFFVALSRRPDDAAKMASEAAELAERYGDERRPHQAETEG